MLGLLKEFGFSLRVLTSQILVPSPLKILLINNNRFWHNYSAHIFFHTLTYISGSRVPPFLLVSSITTYEMPLFHAMKDSLYIHHSHTHTPYPHCKINLVLTVTPLPLRVSPRQEGSIVFVPNFLFQTIVATCVLVIPSFWSWLPFHPCTSFHPSINCHSNTRFLASINAALLSRSPWQS